MAEAEDGPSTNSAIDDSCNVLNWNIKDLFDRKKKEGWQAVVDEYKNMPGCSGKVGDSTIYSRIKQINNRASKLRGKALEEFLNKTFDHPQERTEYLSSVKGDSPRKKELRGRLGESEKQNRQLKRKYSDSISKLEQLDSEVDQLSSEYEATLKCLEQVESAYGKVIAQLSNTHTDIDQKMKKELSQSYYSRLVCLYHNAT